MQGMVDLGEEVFHMPVRLGLAAIHRRFVGDDAQRTLCNGCGFAAGRYGSTRSASADEILGEFGKANFGAYEGLVQEFLRDSSSGLSSKGFG